MPISPSVSSRRASSKAQAGGSLLTLFMLVVKAFWRMAIGKGIQGDTDRLVKRLNASHKRFT
jgi:hypothetical protein